MRHFYFLGREIAQKNGVGLLVLLAFFIYWIFVQSALLPLLLHFLTPMIAKYATLQETRLTLLSINQWGYSLILIGGFLLIHFRLPLSVRQSIVLQHGNWLRIPYDIGFALLLLLIALPTVSFSDGLFEYILTKFFETPLPNQIAVQYLLDTRGHFFAYMTMVFVAIIFAPIIEEYLFRGLLLNYLRNFLGPKGALLLTSASFSLFHFSKAQGAGNIPLLISLFIFAMYLGFCYEKRRSLVSSIALHMAFNATSVFRMHFFEG